MADKSTTDDDAAFFAALHSKLPLRSPIVITKPDQELLSLARAVVKTYQSIDDEYEIFILRAAAGENDLTEHTNLRSVRGHWQLSWEDIVGDPNYQYMKFKCKDEYVDEYQGRMVDVQLGGEILKLPEIDHHGITEIKILNNTNPLQRVNVRIRSRR